MNNQELQAVMQGRVALLVTGEQLVNLITHAVQKGINETEKRKSDIEKLYTINEVAKRLGKAHRTVKNLVQCGAIKTTKSGQITELALMEYLNC